MPDLKKIIYLPVFFLLGAHLSGCATAPHGYPRGEDGVSQAMRAIESQNAGDARYLKVRGREFLFFDEALKGKLAEYPASGSADAKRGFLEGILGEARALGEQAVGLEIQRVDGDREGLLVGYKKDAAMGFDAETAKLRGLADGAALDKYRRDLEAGIEPSIKTRGRTMRQILTLPFAPFVNAWMGFHVLTTPHDAPKTDFKEVDLYEPAASGDASDPAAMSDWQLIEHYAPVIAMEKKENTRYAPEDDHFGSVRMEGASAAKAQPKVDVKDPVVYAYIETKTVQDTPVKMLVYTLWFPERPQLGGGFDPEVGSMQGSIIRVSLDRFNRPVVYENVSSCGCYYKIFPTEALESRAKQQYQTPLDKKRFVVENRVPGKIDADVPSLVPAFSSPAETVAFYAAGTHEVVTIGALGAVHAASKSKYRIAKYEELESLPFNGATISLFDQNGLVRNADRPEATLLAPSGMFHPGTPRQRGTLMIYFDQADFDDKALLEKYLRLPEHAFDRAA